MMPAHLLYALADERQRAALDRDRAERMAAHDAGRAAARERRHAARLARAAARASGSRPLPTRVRWVRVRARRTTECLP